MRNQILDAAALFFSERGYEGVSMRDISAVVQVSPANLYHHFRNKPDLIDATLAHVFEARGESLQLFRYCQLAEPGRRVVEFEVKLLLVG